MSDQNPVDREPRDTPEGEGAATDAPLAIGGANSDLAGGPVGTKNRSHVGEDPDEMPGNESADDKARSGQNPPVLTSQRRVEGGDPLPSEQSKAAHKSGTLHEDGLAGKVEAATDDEHPTRDHTTGAPSGGSGRTSEGA